MRAPTPGWPAELAHGPVGVRPLRRADAGQWSEVRLANQEWLTPWESTTAGPQSSYAARHTPAAYTTLWRSLRKAARAGTHLPFAITLDGRLVGQVSAGNVVRGSFNSCYLGYWIDRRVAGRGIATIAVALVTDHCFGAGRLHRVEANVRPENAASRRLLEKLGFREEGMHCNYLLIEGKYRDHLGYAMTAEEYPSGVLARYLATRATP